MSAPGSSSKGSSAEGTTLAELAARVEGQVRGSGERRLSGVRSLPDAGPEHLAPFTDPRYRESAAESAAGAFLVTARTADAPECEGRDLLVVESAGHALAALLAHFHPRPAPAPGIHPTAVVAGNAEVDPSASLGPYVVVGERSVIGAGTRLDAHVVVGRDCRLGRDVWLHPHVVLYDAVTLGNRVEIHSGSVLGADGFGYASDARGHVKVPQVGGVVLGDDVEVGANSAIDRGTLGPTRIEAGTKVDNMVQVGHNVRVGKASLLCGQAGIAGSTRLGDGVILAGQAGVADHIELGDGVQVAAGSAVLRSVSSGIFGGTPAIDIGRYRRMSVLLPRLGELFRRVGDLEKRSGETREAAVGEEDRDDG